MLRHTRRVCRGCKKAISDARRPPSPQNATQVLRSLKGYPGRTRRRYVPVGCHGMQISSNLRRRVINPRKNRTQDRDCRDIFCADRPCWRRMTKTAVACRRCSSRGKSRDFRRDGTGGLQTGWVGVCGDTWRCPGRCAAATGAVTHATRERRT